MTDGDFEKDVERQRRARSRADLQKIIGLVLDSPLTDKEIVQVDGVVPIRDLADLNTDLKTRIVLRTSLNAANGDLKAAEFLMKYGGYTPPTESEIVMDTPRFIDDIGEDPLEQFEDIDPDEQCDAMEGVPIYDDGMSR